MNNKSNRGMIKWMPYQSLTEQAVSLAKMREGRARVEKPLISSDKAEEINEILCHYKGENVRLRFYQSGYILEECGEITMINIYAKALRINKKDVPFKDVLDLYRL